MNYSRKFIIDQEKVKTKNLKEAIINEEDEEKTIDSALLAMKEQKKANKEAHVLEELVSKLDPVNSPIDSRILYELTGMVVDNELNYQGDETDPFEDDAYFSEFDPRWFEDINDSSDAPASDQIGSLTINDGQGDPLL